MKQTREEFEAAYAGPSAWDALARMGLVAEECDCGEDFSGGWIASYRPTATANASVR